MKKFTSYFVALFLGLVVTSAAYGASGSTRMTIGYTDGNMALSLGLQIEVTVQGAIQFPASYVERLKGNRITTLRLAVGAELTQQDNYVFIADKLDGSYLYRQPVERLESGWNDIVLDTPFDISGGDLYIGFQYTSSGEFLSMDGQEDNEMGNWIKLTQGTDDGSVAWQHQSGGNHNLEAIVEGDNLPQNDVELRSVVARRYAQTGGEMPIGVLVRNRAAADINSLEVVATIDGEEPVTYEVTDIGIASNEIALVAVGRLGFGQNGVYDLTVEITKVNGVADEAPDDNTGTVGNIIAKKEYTSRKVLLEHFSTMGCVNCPSAHKTIEDALAYREDIVHVIHHAGYGTDELTVSESETYLSLFFNASGSGEYYAPAVMMDRTNLARYGADDGNDNSPAGPAFFPRRENLGELMDQCLSTPALVTVELSHTYDPATRLFSVSVSGEVPAGDVARLGGSDIRLSLFLTEDGIHGTQAGASDPSDYYHDNALRKVLTQAWGDEVGFDEAAYRSKEYTLTLPEEWKEEDMHVVAFVSNYNGSDPNDRQVYNTETAGLTDNATSGMAAVRQPETLRMFVASGILYIDGDYDEATVYNTSGVPVKVLKGEKEVSSAHLPQGVYFVPFVTGSGLQTVKFMKR